MLTICNVSSHNKLSGMKRVPHTNHTSFLLLFSFIFVCQTSEHTDRYSRGGIMSNFEQFDWWLDLFCL